MNYLYFSICVMLSEVCVILWVFWWQHYRHSLFGGSSGKTIEADLSRLYTATSLMQIDDNIMR